MKNRTVNLAKVRVVKALNLVLMMIPFALCFYNYYSKHLVIDLDTISKLIVLLAFMVVYFYLGKVYDAFQIQYSPVPEIVYSQMLATFITDGLFYVFLCLMGKSVLNIIPGLLAILGQLIMSILWSSITKRWLNSKFPPDKTIIVYGSRKGLENLIQENCLNRRFNIISTMDTDSCIRNLSTLKQAQTVFLSGIHSHERNIILKYCIAHEINVYVIPRIGDSIMSGAKPVHILHLPILRVKRYDAMPEYLFIKNLMDKVISGTALLITSPIMLITAAAIKSYDGGPVFYKQTRLTKDGKEFEIYKFRSMKQDAEKDGIARLSTGEKDDRITPIGKIIRKYRIDELPQLINILKGDISIVGPRPERPQIHKQYCEEMPEFNLRLQAKAGLTGYAQVYGKYNTTPYDKLQMDLMYIAHPSILEDLKIMFATVKIIFVPESTEGISVGSIIANNNFKN